MTRDDSLRERFRAAAPEVATEDQAWWSVLRRNRLRRRYLIAGVGAVVVLVIAGLALALQPPSSDSGDVVATSGSDQTTVPYTATVSPAPAATSVPVSSSGPASEPGPADDGCDLFVEGGPGDISNPTAIGYGGVTDEIAAAIGAIDEWIGANQSSILYRGSGLHEDQLGVHVLIAAEGLTAMCQSLDSHLESSGAAVDLVKVFGFTGSPADEQKRAELIGAAIRDMVGEGEYFAVNPLRVTDDDPALSVQLLPARIAVAGSLIAAYGDSVQVWLGWHMYPGGQSFVPDPCVNAIGSTPEWLLREPVSQPSILVEPERPVSVVSGEQVAVRLHFTNVGAEQAWMGFNPGQALYLVVPATGVLVAGPLVEVGLSRSEVSFLPIQPGESFEHTMVIGTSACPSQDGYALPPGSYQVWAPAFAWGGIGDQPGQQSALSARIAVEVTG